MQHRTLIHSTVALAVLALAIAGCKTTTAPLLGQPDGVVEHVGQAQAAGVRLRMHSANPGYHVQVQGWGSNWTTDWTTGQVTLHSDSANGDYDAGVHTMDLAASNFAQEPPGTVLGGQLLASLTGQPGQLTIADIVDNTGDNFFVVSREGQGLTRIAPTTYAIVSSDYRGYVNYLSKVTGAYAMGEFAHYAAYTGSDQLDVDYGAVNMSPWPVASTQVIDMVVSGSRLYVLTATSTDVTLSLYALNDKSLIQSRTFAGATTGGLGADNGTIALALPGLGVKLVNPVTLTDKAGTVPAGTTFHDVDVSGDTLYLADGDTIVRYNTTTQASKTADIGQPVDSVAISAGTAYFTVPTGTSGLYKLTESATPPAFVGDVSVRPLRPADDYQAQVFLKDAQDRLRGSVAKGSVALKPGSNVLDLTVTENTEALNAGVQNGNTITWDGTSALTANLLTGIANSLPGVAKVEVSLSGECYTGGARIVTLTDAASWKTYAWNLNAATGTYVPANVVRGKSGILTVKAYDSHGTVVGTSTITIQIDFPAPLPGGPVGGGDPTGGVVPCFVDGLLDVDCDGTADFAP